MRKLCVLFLLGCSAWAQGPGLSCVSTAVNPLIRAEGLAEKLGDILLECSGGPPDAVINGNLTAFLSANVTNRLSSTDTIDAVLTVNNGSGAAIANAPARLGSASSVTWEGLRFALSPQGRVTLRISNLRSAAGSAGLQSVIALLSFNGASLLSFNNNRFSIGVPTQALLSSTIPMFVASQVGSRLPESIDFNELLRTGTVFSSSRITEGFAAAFERRQPMSDSGTRILIRYAGFPSDARLFVPDFVAGANAARPTAAGDFGGAPSAGRYAPSANGSLLLARVFGADASGAGGFPLTVPQSGTDPADLGPVSELPIASGRAFAVYEVVDTNNGAVESAQIPTFLGLPRSIEARSIFTTREVSLAPVSSVFTASQAAPIPRFLGTVAPTDCTILGDCSGSFLPRLQVDKPALNFTGIEGSQFQFQFIGAGNAGGGSLFFTASIQYRTGSNYLRVFPESGVNGANIRVDVLSGGLQAGTYEATLIIDAGPQAGTARIPITVTVLPRPTPPPPPAPSASIRSITNAASARVTTLVAGSLATVFGSNFAGENLQVTFDGIPARVLFANAGQINVETPASLASRVSAQVVVSVNGTPSAPVTVSLAPAAPAVFDPGILNQDNSVNRPQTPALVGSIIQIFATGVFVSGPERVEVKLHDRMLDPLFAGAAPGIAGVQQINVRVPADLPAMTTELQVCSRSLCGPPVLVTLRQ